MTFNKKKYNKEYRSNKWNKEHKKAWSSEYYLKYKEYFKGYKLENKEHIKGLNKSNRTMELLGCTIDELWTHLESKFTDGMTRDNHGTWHVDHIKACTKFDLTDPEQQQICFHWSNLQPLWAHDNIRKGNK